MTIASMYELMKRVIEKTPLNKLYKSKLEVVKNSGTIIFNEVHTLSKGKDVQMIPTIRDGLAQLGLHFTIVNMTACTDDINDKAWGVPKDKNHLVEADGVDEWLNPTDVHTILCGMKVTWENVAEEVGLDFGKLSQSDQKEMDDIFKEIQETTTYNDQDDMNADLTAKQQANKKLQRLHPGIDTRVFTDMAIHKTKLAITKDMIDHFTYKHGTDVKCLVFTYNNAEVDGEDFSYSEYAVQYLNSKAGKVVAHAYDSTIDKQKLKTLREDFENNKGKYNFLVCKCQLIEDFNKIDLRYLINIQPVNNPRSARRKQKYYRVRRTVLTNPLDAGTNIKELSHVYQATSMKQMNDLKGKYTDAVVEALDLKTRYPNAESPELLALIEAMVAKAIETKIAANSGKDNEFDKQDVQIPDINELDEILKHSDLDDYLENLKSKDDETYIAPGVTVHLHKVTDVQSGKAIVIRSKCWQDLFKQEKWSAEQYARWMRGQLIIY
jgi:hypothetical protein